MSQTQQKIFADFENTGHLQPSVKEQSTALQANIAALILAMITVSPNLLSAEFSELATLYRPRLATMLLDDDVVTDGARRLAAAKF
jgi:hypothetical protein